MRKGDSRIEYLSRKRLSLSSGFLEIYYPFKEQRNFACFFGLLKTADQ